MLLANKSPRIKVERYIDKKLISKYDVYQHLMNYWNEVMKDDIYMLVEDGWKVQIYLVKDKKGKQKDWGSDLIPKQLVVNKYFAAEQEGINNLNLELDSITQQIEEIKEENSGEEGLLDEVTNDKGNITKGDLTKRIKEIKNDAEFADELELLENVAELMNSEAETKKKIKEAEAELDKKLFKKYKELTEEEIKILVVDDKWMTTLEKDIKSELDRITQILAERIKELAERYENTLPQLDNNVKDLENKVAKHLEIMGFKWN